MVHGPPARRKSQQQHQQPNNGNGNGNGQCEMDMDPMPTPPDGGWGWVVVFGSFMIHIVTDGMTYSFGIFHNEFLTYFNEGNGYTAWIASIMVGVTFSSGPISSSFVNRYGCRTVTIAGAILAAGCIIVSMFAQNVATLIVTIGFGTGLGFGLIYLPAIVSVTQYFEARRSLATGIAVCGSGFGTFIRIAEEGRDMDKDAQMTQLLGEFQGLQSAAHVQLEGNAQRLVEAHRCRTVKHNRDLVELLQVIGIDAQLRQRDVARNGNQFVQLLWLLGAQHLEHFRVAQLGQPLLGVQLAARAQQHIDPAHIGRAQQLLDQRLAHHARSAGDKDLAVLKELAQFSNSIYILCSYKKRSPIIELGLFWFRLQEMTKCCGCISCSKETRDTFAEMMNFSLLKDAIFVIFAVSNFCTSIGFNMPYLYVVSQAETLDISKKDASYLIASIGVANTVGRIILGYIADKPWVNRLLIYNVCLTACGVATAMVPLCQDYNALLAYCSVFGFTIGAYVGLTSVILVDLLGLEKLTNAFGLLLLFQGIASFIGPPIGGWMYDITQSYSPAFLMAGIMIAISGLVMFAIPPLQRYQEHKAKQMFNSEQLALS
ncbi:uncharacterized protein Dmoj_GI21795 [Drosophila mojavensis]|uniref:Major facilitator superfamily (MFS) profile domain-containing protein n=1 Tax=Drosophila mojavensis TaxID=7230 RepID=B4L5T6_DROMO|nr:uncharacterized protein Dmoj_GI21795 [Drosophila mojavensis]